MSLVRYKSYDSLEPTDSVPNSNNLVVVYKNKTSNEVVLYNSDDKEFQIVKLNDGMNRVSDERFRRNSTQSIVPIRNILDDDNDDDDDLNNGNHTVGRGRRRKRRRSRRSSGRNDRKDDANNNSLDSNVYFNMHNDDHDDDDEDNDNDNDNDNTFVCSNCGAYNHISGINSSHSSTSKNNFFDSRIKTLTNSNFNPLNFTKTSSGDLIRGDYFRLLTNSMYKNDNKSNECLIEDIKSSNFNQYKFNSIPENLINQGYFNKFFKILSKLGTGSYGSVYKVEHELLGLNLGIFALKKIAIGDDVNNLRKILSEVKFLYDLSCHLSDNNNNNVVKYNHVWIEIDQVSRFSPKIPVVFLLFEYCDGGTLEDWVDNIIKPKFNLLDEKLWRKRKFKNNIFSKKSRFLNNFEILKIFTDVTQGLNYLHNLKILHRDLKPSNCLFKSKFDVNYNLNSVNSLKSFKEIPTLLVSDFGESIMVNTIEENWQNNFQTTGTTGTLEFCAPEIIMQRKKSLSSSEYSKFGGFSYASDIYSLGMILYYLCFGELPFSKKKLDPDDMCNEILSYQLFNNLYNLRPLINNLNDYNEENNELLIDWIELIENLVSQDPNDRPTTSEVLNKIMIIYNKIELYSQRNDNEGDQYDIDHDDDNDDDDDDDDNDDDYIYKSDNETEDEELECVSDGEYNYHAVSKSLFKKICLNSYIWIILMFLNNLTLLYRIDCNDSIISSVKILTNVQFLIMGLYFGVSSSNIVKHKWIFISELIITLFVITIYVNSRI